MQEIPVATQATTTLVHWQAFAAEGTKILTEEAASRAQYEQLYPLKPLADARQPNPIRFYGPGPDGRVHPHDPPVGTLHFARWKHELGAADDPEGSEYCDEHCDGQIPLMIKSKQNRPTYTTKGNQTAKEISYCLWEKVTADSMKDVKTYPGSKATRAYHEEYLLNENDFNDIDSRQLKVTIDLDNRLDEDPKNIYPLGYRLLKKWSKANGYPEWEEGMCLGPDPHSPNALTKHLGWFPKRLREIKAGLGADPQDAIWNEVFHGNFDTKPEENFVPPKPKWSEDPDKVTTFTSCKNGRATLSVVSREALKTSLSLPEPDTLNARNIWLDTRAPKRAIYKIIKAVAPSDSVIKESTVPRLPEIEVVEDTESEKGSKNTNRETLDTEPTSEAETSKSVDQEETLGINPGTNNKEGEKHSHTRMETITRGTSNEATEAIETRLKELSVNPEPGHEGKRPIVIYSSLRSKFLGTPVTVVLGYEG